MRGGAEDHLATPMNVNISPNSSVDDVDSCVDSHHYAHNACKSKFYINGSDVFVNMSENELQGSLLLDRLVHCDAVHDDIDDVNGWPETEIGALTTGVHAVKQMSTEVR